MPRPSLYAEALSQGPPAPGLIPAGPVASSSIWLATTGPDASSPIGAAAAEKLNQASAAELPIQEAAAGSLTPPRAGPCAQKANPPAQASATAATSARFPPGNQSLALGVNNYRYLPTGQDQLAAWQRATACCQQVSLLLVALSCHIPSQ